MKMRLGTYRKEMQKYRSRRDSAGVRLYDQARWNYLKLLEKQEIFWRQRAKQFWLRDGDSNTRFFHKFASTRKDHNRISRLKDDNGEWQETEEGIQTVITQYFENLFCSTAVGEKISERVKFKKISEEESHTLIVPIVEEEVKDAVFGMHADKSPGIDGFNPAFFQAYWDIVGADVVAFCQRFFEYGEMPEDINRTLVCLIPKVKKPNKVADLRPISLCNVLMRILSKVLANRLKPTLNSIISTNQSAFIEGRLLTDNALIAFEANHYIRRKTQGINGVAGMKVDVSKAYDRLEWTYIEWMLHKFGFPQKWIERVMQCIRSVSYCFIRDGKIFGDVVPQRGVRQGDPISPYVYIICAEGLSGLIRHYEDAGLLYGCKIARGAPRISHLLFADDCYFFFQASIREANLMKTILQKYENVSGQVVNYNKSDVVFSPNTRQEERVAVCDILGVRQVDQPGKYLGMPMCVGKSKVEVFGFLHDRLKQKLQVWYNKELSKIGKLTMLTSSAQTVSIFWMSLFLIPATLCDEMERTMNAFLWGRAPTGKGVKWILWKKLCMPKSCEGLGVRDLKNFNLSMLAKQGWRLLNESNPLVSAILKAKYYPKSNFLEAEVGNNPSYVWRSIMAAMDVVKAGTRRKIGNGEATKVWDDSWLPDKENGFVTTVMPDQLQGITVASFMIPEERRWDMEVVNDICNSRDVELIKRIPIPLMDRRDSWYWMLEDNGEFTVKSCYRWLQGENDGSYRLFWNKLWSLRMPHKVTNFIWRVSKGCLPTASALAGKGISIDTRCPWCHSAEETDVHALFLCEFAKTVWYAVGLSQIVQTIQTETAFRGMVKVFEMCSRNQCIQFAMFSWSLWNRRNRWLWDKINGSAYGVKATACNLIRDWKEAQAKVVHRNLQNQQGDRTWRKPDEGWVKVNMDAAVFGDGSISVGSVIRDANGCFIGARCRRLEGSWSPREAEAMSMKEALSWVIEKGFKHCVFESDSKCLVTACNGSPGEAFFGTLVSDCVYLLKHISPVLVRFSYRSANTVAHELARAAYSMSDIGEWYVIPPNFISHVLEIDKS